MSEDFKTSVKFGADTAELSAGMNRASAEVRNATGNIKGSFASLGSSVKTSMSQMTNHIKESGEGLEVLKGKLIVLSAVLSGGKLFKDAISDTVNMAKEAMQLSRVLGISATEASVLSVALNDIYQSADKVLDGTSKITKALGTNEAAFKKLGVATRDQNGHFRNSFEIMLDVNKRLGEFKEGTDRNIEANKIYGRSFREMLPIIALTSERMEESRKKAEALGLELGVEGAAKVSKYRASMNDLNDIFHGVSKAVGEALMPVLSDMADFFSKYGPQAVQVMRVAMATLVSAFYGLKEVVQIVWETVKAEIQKIVVAFMTLAEVGSKALTFDFKTMSFDFAGAKAAWARGTGQMIDIGREWGNKLVADAENNRDKIFAAWSSALNPQKAIKGKSEGATSEGGDDKGTSSSDKTRMANWEAELAETKSALTKIADAQGQYREMTASEEHEFWAKRLALVKGNAAELAAVTKKLGDLEVAGIKGKYEKQLESLKTEEVAVGNNFSAKRAIVLQEMALYDKNGKEYSALKKHLAGVDLQALEQQQRLSKARAEAVKSANLEIVSVEEETARFQVDMGLKTAGELLQQEQQFEQRRYVIKLQALQDELALMAQDPGRNIEQIAKLNEQKEELERQHQTKLMQIKRQATLEQTKDSRALFGNIGSAFQATIKGMVTGTMTFKQAMSSMGKSVLGEFANLGAKMMVDWAMRMARKLLIYAATSEAETAVAATSAATQAATQKTAGIAGVMSNSAVAATAAMASVAAIPLYGWAMAPEVGAATYAIGLGYLASAEGGYDIPAGVNPLVQTHQKEMILPAEQAETIRELGRSRENSPIQINTVGGDFIHKKDLAALLKKMNRNFAMVK